MKTSKSKLFSNAWAAAKIAAIQFGGKSTQYFAMCLKNAYAKQQQITDVIFTQYLQNSIVEIYLAGEKSSKEIEKQMRVCGISADTYKKPWGYEQFIRVNIKCDTTNPFNPSSVEVAKYNRFVTWLLN